jgi:sec-independent protein translocase protein TatA
MMGIGFPELMIILVIIMIIFGAGKLPEIGSAFGRSIKNFKTSMKEAEEEEETAKVEEGQQGAIEEGAEEGKAEEGKAEEDMTEEEKEAAIRKKAEEEGEAKDKAMKDEADMFTASLPRKGSYDFSKDQEKS